MTELRPYQTEVIAELVRERAAGKRRIILVAPTASGKTVIAAAIIKQAIEEFQDVLVLAHRREIISQTSRKLFDQEIAHGIIQAGMEKLRARWSACRSARCRRSRRARCAPTAWNCPRPTCW